MGFNNLIALVYFYFILQLHLEIRKFGFKKKRGRSRGAEGREGKTGKGKRLSKSHWSRSVASLN